MEAKEKKTLQFLESLRYIAQQGLHYATGDHHDQARYQQLLRMAAEAYGQVLALPSETVRARLQADLGHITPKVGVSGALFDAEDRLFLVKRHDDQRWSLPCGWCDVNESPEQALAREFAEEVGWPIEAQRIVNAFTRLPGEHDALFTSYHLVYLCQLTPDNAAPPPLQLEPTEVLEARWWDLDDPQIIWHREHESFARAALRARQGV